MRILLPLLLALLATSVGAGPYDGRYRPDHPSGDSWDCTTIGRNGGAVLLTSDVFFALGSRCALRNATRVQGLDATLYDAVCRGEGAPFERRLMIMKTGNGIAVIQKGGQISLLRKCE